MARVKQRIFVADDDPIVLRGLDLALTGRGYEVRAVPSGRELLTLLESESPDLIVIDVMMPGMTGLEVLRRIRRDGRWPDLPVLMVTARADAVVEAAAWERGASEVLAKPFRLGELLERVAVRLGREVASRGAGEGEVDSVPVA